MKILAEFMKLDRQWGDWNLRQLKKFQDRGGSKVLRILIGLILLTCGIAIISFGIGLLVTLIGIIPGLALILAGSWVGLAGIGIIRYKKP